MHIWRGQPEIGPSGLEGAPGTFLGLSQDAAQVLCGQGSVLNLLQVQLPAKSRITGREFASGAHLRPGEVIFRSKANP